VLPLAHHSIFPFENFGVAQGSLSKKKKKIYSEATQLSRKDVKDDLET
jgi:hypothetical protein